MMDHDRERAPASLAVRVGYVLVGEAGLEDHFELLGGRGAGREPAGVRRAIAACN